MVLLNQIVWEQSALEKAVEFSPNNLEDRWNLGGIYYNTGFSQTPAIEQLMQIVRLLQIRYWVIKQNGCLAN